MARSPITEDARRGRSAQTQVKPRHARRLAFAGVCLVVAATWAWTWFRQTVPGAAGANEKSQGVKSPAAAWSGIHTYLGSRRSAPIETLRQTLTRTLSDGVQGHYSLYLEDLNTGVSLGIDDNRAYHPWSLLKVAVMGTVLKKIEQGIVSPGQTITLTARDLETYSLFPMTNHPGDALQVRQLVERLITLSDNSASFALARLFNAEDFQRTLQAMGLPTAPPDQPRNYLPPISPREFANALRALYYPSFLTRPFRELAQSLMAATVYDSQIRMGLPAEIAVAHKVGFNASAGDFHDGGIVYLPGRPYILCVMSAGTTREESERVIRTASRQIYEFYRSADTGRFPRRPKRHAADML